MSESHDIDTSYIAHIAQISDDEQKVFDTLIEKYEPKKSKYLNKPDTSTDDILKELERLTIELSLAVEERKLNEYFDAQYRIYLVEQLSVSQFFTDKIDKIIELVKGETIQILTDNDIAVKNNQNLHAMFMPEKSSEFIISIKSSTFIDTIMETYTTDRDIINQFLADFFRQIVSINNIIYKDIDDLFLELSSSNRKTTIKTKAGKPISAMMLMLLITCQSSHYLSYLYPHNAITEIRENAILTSEIKSDQHTCQSKDSIFYKPEFTDPKANYFVMNSNEFNVTNIVIDRIDIRPEVGCIIESTYKIFDTHNCEKVYDIHAETIFNERSNRCLIKYKIVKS